MKAFIRAMQFQWRFNDAELLPVRLVMSLRYAVFILT